MLECLNFYIKKNLTISYYKKNYKERFRINKRFYTFTIQILTLTFRTCNLDVRWDDSQMFANGPFRKYLEEM